MFHKLLLIIPLVLYFQVSTGLIFKNPTKFPTMYSVSAFDRLVKAEIEFVDWLKNSLAELEEPAKDIAIRYLKNFEDTHQTLRHYNNQTDIEVKVNAVAGNLIATYLKIKRFLEDLYPLVEFLISTQPEMVAAFLDVGYNENDVSSTQISIIKTVNAYNMPVSEFVEGKLLGIDTGVKLNARYCFEIGSEAAEKEMFVVALPFLEVAAEKATLDGTMNETVIEETIQRTIKTHDWLIETQNESAIQFQNVFNRKLGPLREQFGDDYKFMRISNRVLNTRVEIPYPPDPDLEHPFYYDICASKNLQSEEEKSRLFCWYERGLDPYWYINPLKMELLSSFIEVVQMYDMLGEKAMKHMKELVRNRESRHSARGAFVDLSTVRDSTDPELMTLHLSFEKFSGQFVNTSKSSSESLRISAYAPGLNFMSHMDQEERRDDRLEEGDLGATGLYILEAPELGGETIFVHGRFTSRPIPGSLLYWIGLTSQGKPDRDTIHGGCPSILGRKWLAGRWTYYMEQFQTQRCGLKPNDKIKLFPKSKILRNKYYNKERFMYSRPL